MEKIIYLLWSESLSADKKSLAEAVINAGAEKVRINVADNDVAVGSELINAASIANLPNGIITFWLPTSYQRAEVEQIISRYSKQCYGYSVCESEPIINEQLPTLGERTTGFNQVVFLQKPDHLSREEYLTIWLESHTKVAIDTQQTFGYRQNIVVRRFDKNAPEIDSIIEENFPIGALTDEKIFYAPDVAGEKTMLQQMMESCFRFIDFKRMNRLITSEYNY